MCRPGDVATARRGGADKKTVVLDRLIVNKSLTNIFDIDLYINQYFFIKSV